jgi:RNA polymerase sigma-70 factor (ECF subfamily)
MSLKMLTNPALAAPRGGAAAGVDTPAADGLARAQGPADAERAEPEVSPLASVSAPAAFTRVYDEHFTFVWRSLRMLSVADDTLEDAAQDVFTVVSRQLDDFAGKASLRTWIFAIVQRTAANYRRKHRRKIKPLVPLGEVVAGHEPTPHAHAEALEAANQIERFCDSLDPERRALFVLSLLEQVPAPEVSRALAIPLNTVYSRVRALRAGLERALHGDEEAPDELA